MFTFYFIFLFKLNFSAQNQRCGKDFGNQVCGDDNPYGKCCSNTGYCGNSDIHCNIENCQSGCLQYTGGERCGKDFFQTICSSKNPFGKCCSEYGYCGNSESHCNPSTCQSNCSPAPPNPSPKPDPKPEKCGDRFCDFRSETCSNCPQDCGVCKLVYIDKCVTPGDIALTFDDGPSQHTNELLDVLKKFDVTATFFVSGNKVNPSNPNFKSFLRAYNEGHIIGSHTFTHPNLTSLTNEEIKKEMITSDQAIYDLIKQKPIFMRNPYSDNNDRVLSILTSMGYESIFTSIDTKDTEVYENYPNKIYDSVIDALKNKAPQKDSFIVTQHDTIWRSIYYVQYIIQYIRSKGYNLVGMDQCRRTNPYRLALADTCGNRSCDGYLENCQTCPKDCGTCPR